jgi:hypothetical protein
VGHREIIEQLLVRRGFLQRVELLSVQVLHQGVTEQLVIRCLPDDGRDHIDSGKLAGSPPALAHDELEPAVTCPPHHHRLQQADDLDGRRQFGHRVLVEHLAWLPGVRHDRADRYLVQVGA